MHRHSHTPKNPANDRTPFAQAKYELRQQLGPTISPLTAAIGLGLGAGSLQAAIITVDTLDDTLDNGVCSLRSATYAATTNAPFAGCTAGSGPDTIRFASGLTGTIQLDAGASGTQPDASLRLGSEITIDGPGRDNLTIRGDDASPVIYAKYDGSNYTPREVAINGVTITNGRADFGGGIYSRVPSLRLERVRISNNVALVNGGGVWQDPLAADWRSFVLHRSEITGNQAASDTQSANRGGGGVGVDFNGYPSTINISQTSFQNNVTNGKGGGLFLTQFRSDLTLSSNTFSGNRSKYAGGGAWLGLGFSEAEIYNNQFLNNDATAVGTYATGNGGGLFLREDVTFDSQADLWLDGNSFDNNSAQGSGGGAYIRVDDETIGGTKQLAITGNDFGQTSAEYNQAGGNGGAFYIVAGNSVDVTLENVRTRGNSSGVSGGGISIEASNAQLSLDSVAHVEDEAGDYGGGFYAQLENVTLEAIDHDAERCLSTAAGGGLALFTGSSGGTSITATSSRLLGNDSGFGGGLLLNGAFDFFNLQEARVSGNSASVGAGINAVGTGGDQDINIKYSELSGNVADLDGGGMVANVGSGRLRLFNSTVSGNSTAGEGGGLWLTSDATETMALSYSTIAYNSADVGGGVFLSGAETNIFSTILSGNSASTNGPALDGTGTANVSYSLIDDVTTSASFVNEGNNRFKYAAELKPLNFNGGFTRTHEPGETSPALNAGPDSALLTQFDQRLTGFPRLFGSNQDIGAFERQSVTDRLFQDRFEEP